MQEVANCPSFILQRCFYCYMELPSVHLGGDSLRILILNGIASGASPKGKDWPTFFAARCRDFFIRWVLSERLTLNASITLCLLCKGAVWKRDSVKWLHLDFLTNLVLGQLLPFFSFLFLPWNFFFFFFFLESDRLFTQNLFFLNDNYDNLTLFFKDILGIYTLLEIFLPSFLFFFFSFSLYIYFFKLVKSN